MVGRRFQQGNETILFNVVVELRMTSGAGTLVDLLYTTCGNSPEWRILTHATRGNPPLVEFPRVADKWPKLLATQGNFPKIDHFPASGRFPRVADNTRTRTVWYKYCIDTPESLLL